MRGSCSRPRTTPWESRRRPRRRAARRRVARARRCRRAARLTALARSLAKENDPRARTTYAALSAAAPNDAGLLSEYGGVLLASGDVDAALAALRRAAEASPTSAAAHANLAAALRKKGDAAE